LWRQLRSRLGRAQRRLRCSDQPAAVEIGGGEPGRTETEIRFGMSAPFSGSAKELGRQNEARRRDRVQRHHDVGGVHGRQVKLVAVDDGYEPTRTAETMKQLYEKDQVFGIIAMSGPNRHGCPAISLKQRMMFFGAFTGANLLRRDPPDRYVFNFKGELRRGNRRGRALSRECAPAAAGADRGVRAAGRFRRCRF